MSEKNVKIHRARHDKENPYYLACRDTAQDKRLSYEALGMLNYILSKPDDWEVQPADLQRAGCGRNQVYRILNDLIRHRYIERIYHRDAKGRVLSVEYIAHEKPHLDEPLPENQEMDNQEMENGDSTYKREDSSQNKEKNLSPKAEKKTPEPDKWDAAIKTVWATDGTGWLNNLKSMLFGNAKKGEWAKCKFDPPVTDPAEIVSFGEYARRRMREKNITDVPTACVTIQRWFYDFRAQQARKAAQPPRTNPEVLPIPTADPAEFMARFTAVSS